MKPPPPPPTTLAELQAAVRRASIDHKSCQMSSGTTVKTEDTSESVASDYFAGAIFGSSTHDLPDPARDLPAPCIVLPPKASSTVSVAGLSTDQAATQNAILVTPATTPLETSSTSSGDTLQPARAKPVRTQSEYPQYPDQSHAALHSQRYPEPHKAPYTTRPSASQAHHLGFGHAMLAHALRDSLSIDRQIKTAGNTPIHTPGLFNLRSRQPLWESSDETSPYPSPYLHPVQPHAPKE